MQVHIYNPPSWPSAVHLKEAIEGHGHQAWICNSVIAYTGIPCVCWGWPHQGGTLNSKILGDKLIELKRLAVDVPVPPFTTSNFRVGEWIARKRHHKNGNDLLPGSQAEFWTLHVDTVKEYRVHVYKERVIRLGLKFTRDPNSHPWIRSWDNGWRVDYTTHSTDVVSERVCDVAIAAIRAVGYDFGAVDVGVTAQGHPVVFEVNSAPGLMASTADLYADAIMRDLSSRL